MNLGQVEKIAKAVLYEGYMLYPYRPSSVKNQQRWNFGVLYPKAYSDAHDGNDGWSMQTECLIQGNAETVLQGRVRFLQLRSESGLPAGRGARSSPDTRQGAVERDAGLPEPTMGDICVGVDTIHLEFPLDADAEPDQEPRAANTFREALRAEVEISACRCEKNLFKLRVQVRNMTAFDVSKEISRDQALQRSLISCHVVLGVNRGEFVSSLEPPAELQEVVAECRNIGAWPVLVGEQGQRDTLLASPIILYDYPQIAPESPGDLFDGTEIDEILSLRILTLTENEKREIRQSDERARQILERTEQLPAEQFMKLHGAVRSLRPLKENEL
jgi:hypothetical protein